MRAVSVYIKEDQKYYGDITLIVWFTGNSGAGKSTLARSIKKRRFPESVWLDGDAIRKYVLTEIGFSESDRNNNNRRTAGLAKLLSQQGHLVLISSIAPFEKTREEITKMCDPAWVFVNKEDLPYREDRPYEKPVGYFTIENTWCGDYKSPKLEEAIETCLEYIFKEADRRGFPLQ